MSQYEIWIEGFSCSGNNTTASRVTTTAVGNTFEEACLSHYSNGTGLGAYNASPLYSPSTNSVWGCKLFDNEMDARQAFG